jgi:sodium/potassium-transporting ATPase subunit alpha
LNNIQDIASLDWHLLDVREVCNRLGVSETSGLDSPMVKRRLERDGRNVITPPHGTWDSVKKIFWSAFGGFGFLLLTASVICFIAWSVVPSRFVIFMTDFM